MNPAQRKLVARIRHLHAAGEPLNIQAIRARHPGLLEAVYAIKPFWGWKQALEASGIRYSQIRTKHSESVQCLLCGQKFRVLYNHIRTHNMRIEDYLAEFPGRSIASDTYRDIEQCCRKKAAIPHWEKNWNPEYVLDRLFEYHTRGVRLYTGNMRKVENSIVVRVIKYFKKWNTALLAIGLDPQPVIARKTAKWDRESIIQAISKLQAHGKEVNFAAVLEYDKSLAYAAYRCFNGYPNALKACGLDPAKIVKFKRLWKYRSKSDVINAICRRKIEGKPLSYIGMEHGEHRDGFLVKKASDLFGTWRAAIEAAGFDYENIRVKGERYRTRVDVIKGIQQRHGAGLPLTRTGMIWGPNRDRILYRDALRHFSSWWSALRVAVRGKLPDRFQLLRHYPTKESVIDALRTRHRTGLPVTAKEMMVGQHRAPSLCRYARRYYGTLITALKRAEIMNAPVRPPGGKYPNKTAVLREIRRRFKQGMPLTATISVSRCSHADKALYKKGQKYFGQWKSAVQAAGIDYSFVLKQKRTYSSKESVMAEIARRYKSGLAVNISALTIGPDRDVELLDTARSEFGTWGNACRNAGIDYDAILNLRRKYPTKKSIIQEIRRRKSAGLSIKASDVNSGPHSDTGLKNGALREFGLWANALQATGIRRVHLASLQ